MTGKYLKRKIRNTKKHIEKLFFEIRRAFVKLFVRNKNFSIISNNCWAGKVYQYFNLPYLSPTVGLYFFAEDYIRFIKNLRYYLTLEPVFLAPEQSKYYIQLKEKNQLHIPVAKLDDVEIVFLHYKSAEEAAEKWKRRAQRVNYEHIIIKFSKMNLCTDEMLKEFDELPFSNKFVFVPTKKTAIKSAVYLKSDSKDEILNDSTDFPGKIPLIRLLSKKRESYNK